MKNTKKITTVAEVLNQLKIALIYISFSFEFFGLEVYFKNNFVNQLTKWRAFKPVKIPTFRVLLDLKISPSAQVFKSWWNTPAHISYIFNLNNN